MKVLVTGATGFIGNYVITELLKQGHEVVASSSSAEKATAAAWYSGVHYVQFDLSQWDADKDLFLFFGRPDAMIHLAWEGLPNYNADFHLTANLPRHTAFLTNLVKNGLKDLSVSGTCLEYGMQEGRLSETMPCSPSNPYARAKEELRQNLEKLQAAHPFHFKWIRLFYMYGAGQSPKSLISQLEKALEAGDEVFNMSGGEQIRDFLPVETVAAYIVKVVLQQQYEGIINCCSGVPVSVRQFVEDCLRSKKRTIKLNLGFYPYTDYEPMRFWGDNGKLKQIIT